MPDWNLASTWADFYDIAVRDPNHPAFGSRVGYGRVFAQRAKNPYTDSIDLFAERIQALASRSSYTPNTKVFVIGCGFGYLMEVINDAGGNAVGTDTSTWIHAHKATEAREDIAPLILNIDISSSNAETELRRAIGGNGKVDWVITEDVMSGIPISDQTTFLDNCERFLGNQGQVAHFVTCNPGNRPIPPTWEQHGLRWQTLEDWAALRPAHLWLSVNESYRALGG